MRTLDGEINAPMRELRERALSAPIPLIDDDCAFSAGEWVRERYEAHLTLAMADIPPRFFDEILRFCQGLGPIGPEGFIAERVHLYAFESDDWNGAWGESLSWKLLESWKLQN
jgi:hypothetical protein